MTEQIVNYHKQQAGLAKTLFLEKIQVCQPNSNTCQTPFFVPDTAQDDELKIRLYSQELDPKFIIKLNDFSEKIGFSKLLYYLYLYLGTDNREFTLHNYTFFSLSELCKRYATYCQHGQTKFCDLATTYLGMGHVKVLSFSLVTKKIYARHDGGSCGWEREEQWKFSLNLDLSNYPDQQYNLDSFLKGELDDTDIQIIDRSLKQPSPSLEEGGVGTPAD